MLNGKIVQTWNQSHTVIIFVVACIMAIIFGVFISWLFKKTARLILHSKNKELDFFNKRWKKSLLFAFILLLLYFTDSFLSIPKAYSVYYSHLMSLIVIIFFTWTAIQMVQTIRSRIISRSQKNSGYDFNARAMHTRINILFKILIFVIGLIGGAIALMTFPDIHRLGISILASAGVMGIIVGFAAQKSLSNLLVGIQIALTQPIRIDDTVIVEGEMGNIEEITMTYVVVRIWDKRRLIVPISYFVEKIFQNWTRKSSDLVGTVFLLVDYKTSFNELRTALDNALNATKLWDRKTKGLVITDAKSQAVEIRISVSAANSSDLWDLRCYVREQLINFMQNNHPEYLPKSNIEIKNKIIDNN